MLRRCTTPHEDTSSEDTGGEVQKRARIESEHFSIPSLGNHFATSIPLGAYRLLASRGRVVFIRSFLPQEASHLKQFR